MYKPKKYVRLDKLQRAPRLPDIRRLLDEAKKLRSCTVELPWRTENLGLQFSLTVRSEVGGGEPIWTLYEGEGTTSRVMWSTGFDDVELLYDVLTLSLPTDGPNIFAPVEEAKPDERMQTQGGVLNRGADGNNQGQGQSQSYEFEFDRSYDPSAGSSYENALMKPSDNEVAAKPKKEKFPSHLMTEDDYESTQKSVPVEKPAEPEPQPAPAPAPNPNTSGSPAPNAPPPGVTDTGQYQQIPGQPPNYPYPAPGYPGQPAYPPYPYQQQQPYPQGYNYPPGYGPGPGYPAGYPYQQPYPQQPVPEPAHTVPLQPGAAGYSNDPYASHMVAQPPDLLKKRPNVMLGNLLVDAGLVPKATIDAGLQVQVLVSQGTLSAIKAAEAVRRAHMRGSAVEADNADLKVKPNEAVVRVKPQIGQVLVMAGIITAAQLKLALSLQDIVRTGSLSMEEAVAKLAAEGKPHGSITEDPDIVKEALVLLKQSGLLTSEAVDMAKLAMTGSTKSVSKILVAGGQLDQITLDAAVDCQKYLNSRVLKMEQAVPVLHYCQRMRVPFKDAAQELGVAL